jgi:hypothetical protein
MWHAVMTVHDMAMHLLSQHPLLQACLAEFWAVAVFIYVATGEPSIARCTCMAHPLLRTCSCALRT